MIQPNGVANLVRSDSLDIHLIGERIIRPGGGPFKISLYFFSFEEFILFDEKELLVTYHMNINKVMDQTQVTAHIRQNIHGHSRGYSFL